MTRDFKQKKTKSAISKHNTSLDQQILRDTLAVEKKRHHRREKAQDEDDSIRVENDGKIGRKILKEAKLQRDDIEAEDTRSKLKMLQPSHLSGDDSDEDISADDQNLFLKWSSSNASAGASLADLTLQAFKALSTEQEGIPEVEEAVVHPPQDSIHPQVASMYKQLGTLLSQYKSGKLPKPFKVLPALKQWHQTLVLTRPDQWTPHAVHQATRLFVSAGKPPMIQAFLQHILLPHIRISIFDTNRIHPHLFMALKKALYKPAAFFKGLLFPMCYIASEDAGSDAHIVLGQCMKKRLAQCERLGPYTLREAVLIGSLLNKMSIPMLHSAAALMKLASTKSQKDNFQSLYSGIKCIFMRILIDKKYTLPYRVLETLIEYFCIFGSYSNTSDHMTVLWYQALLSFVQRYKHDFEDTHVKCLLLLIQEQLVHPILSKEIARELTARE